METQEQIRELLLGYLLNALSDGEAAQVERELARNPSLRAELATLQREVAPLDHVGDSIEPPPMLANRTCTKIWNTVDNEESGVIPNSGIFLDSACYSPEAMLPAFLLSATSETEEPETEKPRMIKRTETETEPPPRSTPWVGLVASVSVGIIVALVLFPMINYVKRSTQSRVAEMWMNEINQRVDQYEQIHGGGASKVEEVQPYNLALSGWQEIPAGVLAPRTLDEINAFFIAVSPMGPWDPFLLNEKRLLWSVELELPWKLHPSQVLPFFEGLDESIPLDAEGLAGYMLLVIPGQAIPLRSAFGQDFLFQDGRVFSRELPSTEPVPQGVMQR